MLWRIRSGYLAYGSLIGDPGPEIKPLITRRVSCRTPFKVEFARPPVERGRADPTLVPYDDGSPVSAQILVVDLPLKEATDCLYRRETRKIRDEYFLHSSKTITSNTVVVESLPAFQGVETYFTQG